jgi:predicted ATPase/DNA-binding SARP family transcriptional activator/predicted negative regulator of RcsB-dependent stress response
VLTVTVLGPVELRRDGSPIALPTGKTTELLARLAMDAGARVRTDRLLDDLWPAGAGRNALQAKVSKLRHALGDPALITGDADGYTLHIDPAQVDALGPPRLELFRGELPSYGWFAPHRARLEEDRLRLTEEHLEASLGPGVIGELENLVAEHPLREGFWRLLITALAQDGRQADALAAHARVRRILADELGLDPGPALQALEGRILRQGTGNLPAMSASLIGRDADRAAVIALLADPLVTVVGPAGVGKTRLAIEVARAFPAAWLVRLDGATAAWPVIGAAFGMSQATEAMVLDRLRGLDALLVLDNCEHLDLRAVAGRIAGPRILATSQVPLGVDGEIVYQLEPLPIAAAKTLFAERAARQRRSFRASDAAVEDVCRRLDGLPLAIELAAARAKALSIEEIARRLGDRFALLSDPAGRRPPRQRTLRAAIAWSYDLLFPDDQRGLQALACFTGGAPLAAAEEVVTALGVPPAAALDVIGRLVDRSLATVDIAANGAVRYRLLDSVREFARSRLRDSGQEDLAFGAHAAWFAVAAADADSGLRGPDQPQHLSFVRNEHANIDSALAWAAGHDARLGLRMATGLGWAWVFLGAGSDAAHRMRSALAAASSPAAVSPAGGSAGDVSSAGGTVAGISLAERVDAMLFAGWFEASGGDLDRAVAEIRTAVDLADDRAHARLFLAFVHSQQGRADDALAVLAQCRDHLDGWEQGAAWLLTAWASIALGDVARGSQACAEALRRLTPLGDQWALGHAEALLGALAQASGRYPEAVAHLTRAADAADRLGFAAAGSLHRANLGRAHQQNGDPVRAIAALELAMSTARTAGDLRIVALAGTRLARVLRAEGRLDEARAQVRAARRWYATAGAGDGALLADHLAAELDANVPALEQVLIAARAAGDPEVEVLTLDALARLRSDPAPAAEADRRMPHARHLMTDADRRPPS